MSYKTERIKDIYLYYHEYGLEATAKHFDIQQETVSRYCRVYKFKKENKRAPKILILDIETLPMHVRVWGLYKQRIPIDNIINDWLILCWSAKWLCAPEILHDCLTPDDCENRSDKRISESVYKLLEEADIVVGHNLKRFDMRRMQSRFIMHDLKPFSPIQTVDTLVESRKNFAHSSHKLDFLGQLVRNQGKVSTNYNLWVRCESGEQEALDYMQGYCDEDVALEEEVYIWMLPWMQSHPNIGLYQDSDGKVCKRCGAPVKWVDKYQYTLVNRYDSFKYTRCGSYSRGRRTDVTPAERSTVLA